MTRIVAPPSSSIIPPLKRRPVRPIDVLAGRRRQRQLYAQPAPGATAVPDGTIDEVLAWVGNDPQRARLALQAEQHGRQRVTLIDRLDGLAA
jgi:hypothetical protein